MRPVWALAIISAILIVLADREKRNNTPVQHTETETVTPGAPAPPPATPSAWWGTDPADPGPRIVAAAVGEVLP